MGIKKTSNRQIPVRLPPVDRLKELRDDIADDIENGNFTAAEEKIKANKKELLPLMLEDLIEKHPKTPKEIFSAVKNLILDRESINDGITRARQALLNAVDKKADEEIDKAKASLKNEVMKVLKKKLALINNTNVNLSLLNIITDSVIGAQVAEREIVNSVNNSNQTQKTNRPQKPASQYSPESNDPHYITNGGLPAGLKGNLVTRNTNPQGLG